MTGSNSLLSEIDPGDNIRGMNIRTKIWVWEDETRGIPMVSIHQMLDWKRTSVKRGHGCLISCWRTRTVYFGNSRPSTDDRFGLEDSGYLTY